LTTTDCKGYKPLGNTGILPSLEALNLTLGKAWSTCNNAKNSLLG